MEQFFPGGKPKPKAQTPASNRLNAGARAVNERAAGGAGASLLAELEELEKPIPPIASSSLGTIRTNGVLSSKQYSNRADTRRRNIHAFLNNKFRTHPNSKVRSMYDTYKIHNPEKNAVHAMLESDLIGIMNTIRIPNDQKLLANHFLKNAQMAVRTKNNHRRTRRRKTRKL